MRHGDRPFLGQQAVQRGELTARRLQKDYTALYRNTYVSKHAAVDATTRARSAWLWADGQCVLAGLSAAAVLGTKWIDPDLPAEICRDDRHSPSGIVVHTYQLLPDEVCTVDRMQVTTPARTAFDIGRNLPEDLALIHLDALARATRLKAVDVVAIAESRPGTRGIRRLRNALRYMDGGAESPQETRLRMTLVRAGLPQPETQIALKDPEGRVRVRLDVGWREWKVAVEYDGAQHWVDKKQRAWDIERMAMLEASGWVVVRVSAGMLCRPGVVVRRVLEKLRAAGCPI